MKETKQNILKAALKLFNRDGIVNVRLQHIADEAFISVGNLAYHYSNKEAIVSALYETLIKQQRELLAQYRIVPLFRNIDHLLQYTFQLQRHYFFFYADTLEITRAYPTIAKNHQAHVDSQIAQLKNILHFNVSRGALKSGSDEDTFEELAIQIWITTDFWLAQCSIRLGTTTNEQEFKNAVWSLLKPYFTETGKLEYQQMLQLPLDLYF